jgi:CRISP-associated protein Cas1
MSWRIILITKACKLSFKNNQLLYQPKDEDELQVPLEDISAIVIDTEQVNITGYLLSEVANNKITIITTDASHTPNGIFLPYMQYYKNAETAFLQRDWSEPFKKRVWQKIVQQKIQNQAHVIRDINKNLYKHLIELSKEVTSGDAENIEGRAAKEYWQAYYNNFIRHTNSKVNSALDYAYMITRSLIAKNISALGFISCFGLHHCNTYNAFNLADDLIEPFRGIIDFKVRSMYEKDDKDNNLTVEEKQKLIEIMFYEVDYGGQNYSIMYTTQLLAENLLNITKSGEIKNIILPTFPKDLLF